MNIYRFLENQVGVAACHESLQMIDYQYFNCTYLVLIPFKDTRFS